MKLFTLMINLSLNFLRFHRPALYIDPLLPSRIIDLTLFLFVLFHSGLRGRYLFALGPKVENPKAGCLTWYSSQDAETMDTMLVDSEPCPCTWDQAARDTRFVTNAATWCAETRLSKTTVNQRCCYDKWGTRNKSAMFLSLLDFCNYFAFYPHQDEKDMWDIEYIWWFISLETNISHF